MPLNDEISDIESKYNVGKFANYASSIGHSGQIQSNLRPASQFLTGLGCALSAANLTTHPQGIPSALEVMSEDITIDSFDPNRQAQLVYPKSRVTQLLASAKIYVNTDIFPQGRYAHLPILDRASREKCEYNEEYWAAMSPAICHVQQMDFLVGFETKDDGTSFAIPKNGKIGENDSSICLISSPAPAFNQRNPRKNYSLEEQQQFIEAYIRNVVKVAISEGKQYLVMPAAGQGDFKGKPEFYNQALIKVARENPGLNIIYNPAKQYENFNTLLNDQNPALPNLCSTNKDVMPLADALRAEGKNVALLNPSDPDVVLKAADVGWEWYQGGYGSNYLAEEDIAAKSTSVANSAGLNPDGYNRIIEHSVDPILKNAKMKDLLDAIDLPQSRRFFTMNSQAIHKLIESMDTEQLAKFKNNLDKKLYVLNVLSVGDTDMAVANGKNKHFNLNQYKGFLLVEMLLDLNWFEIFQALPSMNVEGVRNVQFDYAQHLVKAQDQNCVFKDYSLTEKNVAKFNMITSQLQENSADLQLYISVLKRFQLVCKGLADHDDVDQFKEKLDLLSYASITDDDKYVNFLFTDLGNFQVKQIKEIMELKKLPLPIRNKIVELIVDKLIIARKIQNHEIEYISYVVLMQSSITEYQGKNTQENNKFFGGGFFKMKNEMNWGRHGQEGRERAQIYRYLLSSKEEVVQLAALIACLEVADNSDLRAMIRESLGPNIEITSIKAHINKVSGEDEAFCNNLVDFIIAIAENGKVKLDSEMGLIGKKQIEMVRAEWLEGSKLSIPEASSGTATIFPKEIMTLDLITAQMLSPDPIVRHFILKLKNQLQIPGAWKSTEKSMSIDYLNEREDSLKLKYISTKSNIEIIVNNFNTENVSIILSDKNNNRQTTLNRYDPLPKHLALFQRLNNVMTELNFTAGEDNKNIIGTLPLPLGPGT